VLPSTRSMAGSGDASGHPVERPTVAGVKMEWSRIVRTGSGQPLEIDDNGIARNARFSGALGQADELKTRELAAAPFLGSSQRALREANRHHSWGVMRERARKVLQEIVGSKAPSESVLVDLGSGFGWQWRDLALEYARVQFVLVDFSLTNLLVCRSLMPFREYPNVLCVHADLVDLPLEDATADYCWSVQVLQHLPRDKRYRGYREIKRVLKPGGRLYLAWVRPVPLVRLAYALLRKTYLERGSTANGMFLQRFNEDTWRELCEQFDDVRLTYSETLFHPDLHWAPRSRVAAWLDQCLGRTPLARLLARQAEVWGASLSRCAPALSCFCL